jgi:hypothetical protein
LVSGRRHQLFKKTDRQIRWIVLCDGGMVTKSIRHRSRPLSQEPRNFMNCVQKQNAPNSTNRMTISVSGTKFPCQFSSRHLFGITLNKKIQRQVCYFERCYLPIKERQLIKLYTVKVQVSTADTSAAARI